MKHSDEILAAMEEPGFDDWRDPWGFDAWDHVLREWHGDFHQASLAWHAACDAFDRKHAPEEFQTEEEDA